MGGEDTAVTVNEAPPAGSPASDVARAAGLAVAAWLAIWLLGCILALAFWVLLAGVAVMCCGLIWHKLIKPLFAGKRESS